ncbi:14463_t:CDS:2, partial [Racocetra persica]
SCERIRVCLENCIVEKDIQTFVKECATGSEIPGENGTRYRKASYERTSVERVLPPSTDKPIGSPQSTKNANYNLISTTNSSQSSQGTGMNYKSLYNFLPFEKSDRASMYANTSSASPHGTIKDSALPQTPIEEVEEPDPIDPGQQTILAVENDIKSNFSFPITKTSESVKDESFISPTTVSQLNNQKSEYDSMEKSRPSIPDDQPIDSSSQVPETSSSPLTNVQHQEIQEIQAHRQSSLRALEGGSSQDFQRPFSSGPGDLRRQTSTPVIGSGSSQQNIQGPGDVRKHPITQSPRLQHIAQQSNYQHNESPIDDLARSSTIRTASSS